MTVPKITTYPIAATNSAWQKKKSFIDKAKSSTKTGLGAALLAAEAKWKLIPWRDLDASKQTVTSVAAAERNLEKAKAALPKVDAARLAVQKAAATAAKTKVNKALSKTAQTAAAAIEKELRGADGRLMSVMLTDFERAARKAAAAAIINMTKVRIQDGRTLVARGASATWDRKVLKVTGVTWTVGQADQHKGKTLTVYGETVGSSVWAEGISKIFQNDMKLDTASGSSATFRA